ncbi:hypothetical protein [Algoriphagus namhaensis]
MQPKSWPSLEEWVESEQDLNQKITELYESDLSPRDQAMEALNFLAERYHLPLTPLDIKDRDWEDAGDSWYQPISLLEQVAQLKFVEPENNDPRYLVLNSAYLIHHKLVIDMSQELGEFLGNEELQGLGYKGEGILDGEVVPVRTGEGWSDLGCKYFVKESFQ